ncbi:MAG: hypothetical protein EAX90_00490 [Candidatus Heimdallarchaeota archaeon]|nr:hypothetical protein [Candidatus Heimdallarchaeota archaeon]
MSVTVKYVCPNCGKRTRENGVEPIKCPLCQKVVCHHCSPQGFCEICFTKIPEESKEKLNRLVKAKKIFTVFIFIFLIVGFAGLAMVIITGTTGFQANNANAQELQNIFLIITGIIFGLLICPIPIIAITITRKTSKIQIEAATMTIQQMQIYRNSQPNYWQDQR